MEGQMGQGEGGADSSAWRPGLPFLGLAFCHDGGMKLGAQVIGQFVNFRVAEDLNGLLGRVADDEAVMAPGQMIFQFRFNSGVEGPIEIVV
jgi:hypothetical protein